MLVKLAGKKGESTNIEMIEKVSKMASHADKGEKNLILKLTFEGGREKQLFKQRWGQSWMVV